MNKKLTSILLSTLLLGECSSLTPLKAANQKNISKNQSQITSNEEKTEDKKSTIKKIALGTAYVGALAGYGIGLYCLLTKDGKSPSKCGQTADSQNLDINPEILDRTLKLTLNSIPEFDALANEFPIEFAETNIAETIFDRNMKVRFKGLINILKFVRDKEKNPDRHAISREFIEIVKNSFEKKSVATYDDLVKISLIAMLKDVSEISSLGTNKNIATLCDRIVARIENSHPKKAAATSSDSSGEDKKGDENKKGDEDKKGKKGKKGDKDKKGDEDKKGDKGKKGEDEGDKGKKGDKDKKGKKGDEDKKGDKGKKGDKDKKGKKGDEDKKGEDEGDKSESEDEDENGGKDKKGEDEGDKSESEDEDENGGNDGNDGEESSANHDGDESDANLDARIAELNISPKLIGKVGKENVFKESAYYDSPGKLKHGFAEYDGQIYHKDTQYVLKGWGLWPNSSEIGHGVPVSKLERDLKQ